MHSSRFFRVKPIGRLFYEVQKKGNHTISYQSLLLSTTVLNDKYNISHVTTIIRRRALQLDHINTSVIISLTNTNDDDDDDEILYQRNL